MVKEDYRQSNKNDTAYQILKPYARIDSSKIQEMNVNADIAHPIYDKGRSRNQPEITLLTKTLLGSPQLKSAVYYGLGRRLSGLTGAHLAYSPLYRNVALEIDMIQQ
ncbi:hypothetical protein HOY80DRAFT_1033254 [Tuber brumale]|nr:hypothetical protein HOY80DRAFT_1033254 [Tuber brumale]